MSVVVGCWLVTGVVDRSWSVVWSVVDVVRLGRYRTVVGSDRLYDKASGCLVSCCSGLFVGLTVWAGYGVQVVRLLLYWLTSCLLYGTS